MKIEIEINNISDFAAGLNNAIIAYNDIRRGIFLFAGLPEGMDPKWETVISHNPEDPLDVTSIMDARLNELKKVYNQIEKIERETA